MERSIARKFNISRSEARNRLELAKVELRGTSPSPQDLVDHICKTMARQAMQAVSRQHLVNDKVTLQIFVSSGSLSLHRETVPKPLARAGVSGDEWEQVYFSVSENWAPMLIKAKTVDAQTVEQLEKLSLEASEELPATSSGTSSTTARQCYEQVYASAHTVSSLGILAANSLATASFLLNPHGVFVQLKVSQERQLGTDYFLPVGLEMTVKRTCNPINSQNNSTNTIQIKNSNSNDIKNSNKPLTSSPQGSRTSSPSRNPQQQQQQQQREQPPPSPSNNPPDYCAAQQAQMVPPNLQTSPSEILRDLDAHEDVIRG